MRLNRIDDPRSNLQRARRYELFKFARANGVREITEDMPADIMREILRNKRLTNIRPSAKPLGAIGANSAGGQPDNTPAPQINATEDLMRQYMASKAPPPADAPRKFSEMTIGELRVECKRLGVKMERTDNMAKLRAKLAARENVDGQDAA